MSNQSRLENIQQMESDFNELQSSLKSLDSAFKNRKTLQPKCKKLMKYYESKQRQKDYYDTNSGKLKSIGPHGILSEDAIYDFANEQRELFLEISKTFTKLLDEI